MQTRWKHKNSFEMLSFELRTPASALYFRFFHSNAPAFNETVHLSCSQNFAGLTISSDVPRSNEFTEFSIHIGIALRAASNSLTALTFVMSSFVDHQTAKVHKQRHDTPNQELILRCRFNSIQIFYASKLNVQCWKKQPNEWRLKNDSLMEKCHIISLSNRFWLKCECCAKSSE